MKLAAVYKYEAPEAPVELRTATQDRRQADRRRRKADKTWYKENENRRESERRAAQRRAPVITIAGKEGTPATVATAPNGMTHYLYRELGDYHAADRLVEWAAQMTSDGTLWLGFPTSWNPDVITWMPTESFNQLMNIHDAIVESPLAQRKAGNMGNRQIVVPMDAEIAGLQGKGPANRRR